MANQLFDYFVVVGLVPLPPSPDQEDDSITFMPQVIDRYPLGEATERCVTRAQEAKRPKAQSGQSLQEYHLTLLSAEPLTWGFG